MEEKKNSKTEPKENLSKTYYGVGGFVLEIIKVVILAFIIIVPVRVFLFQPFFVQGASMEPNFEDGEYLIISEFGFKETDIDFASHNILQVDPFRNIERQKVIVFRYPLDPRKFFIKRVIGLPGEKIEIKDGRITIFNQENPDGFILDESEYLQTETRTIGEEVFQLDENEYFVLGDNRMFSSDSRSWGPITKEDVMGEVALRAWPLNKIDIY